MNLDNINKIIELKDNGYSNYQIAKMLYGDKDKEYAIRRILKKAANMDIPVSGMDDDCEEASEVEDEEEITRSYNKRKAKPFTGYELDAQKKHDEKINRKVQRLQDENTALRRQIREEARVDNHVNSILDNFLEQLAEYTPTLNKTEVGKKTNDNDDADKSTKGDNHAVGVIQLSDLHLGESVISADANGNNYNMVVASIRLKRFIKEAIRRLKNDNVDKILIALTGDMMNSDRRLDEALTNINNRSKVFIAAIDILSQAINEVKEHFDKVYVASVVGNESRINKDFGWVSATGIDNFDFLIHETLKNMFAANGSEVKFIPMKDAYECVVDLGEFYLLLTHGNNTIARNPDLEVKKLKARYVKNNLAIDYVIFGHIHSALITQEWARSSSLVGGNGYSNKALNLSSDASQNVYVWDKKNCSFNAYMIDLSYWSDKDDSYIIPIDAHRTLDDFSNDMNYYSI